LAKGWNPIQRLSEDIDTAVWARLLGSQAEYWCIAGKAQGTISRRRPSHRCCRDLQQLFEKTASLAPILEQILKPFGNEIQCALIWFRGTEPGTCDESRGCDADWQSRVWLTCLQRSARRRSGWEREVNVPAYCQRNSGRESKRATIVLPPFFGDGKSF
jgi:hypothetical protein